MISLIFLEASAGSASEKSRSGLLLFIIMNGLMSFFNTVVGGKEDAKEKTLVLPWEDYKDKAKELNIKGSITDVLKDAIFEISQNEKNFLMFRQGSNPDFFEFDLDPMVETITEVMKEDLHLREMFRNLVPRCTTEELFWKSYFYNVEHVKEEILNKFSGKKNDVTLDEIHKELMDELDKELKDNIEKKPVRNRVKAKSEVQELKQELKKALERIKILEQRVAKLEGNEAEIIEEDKQDEKIDELKEIEAAFLIEDETLEPE